MRTERFALLLYNCFKFAEKFLLFCLGDRNKSLLAYSLESILADLLKDLGLDRYGLKLFAAAECFLTDSSNVLADSYLLKLLIVLEGLGSDLGYLVFVFLILTVAGTDTLAFAFL